MAARPPRSLATEGIVLRRRPSGEADATLVLLTPGEGRLDAVARGVRKPQARLRGHIEPVTRSRFLIARGRGRDVVAQAVTLDAYLRLKTSLQALAAAIYCCELAERLSAVHAPQHELYALLTDTLAALDAGANPEGSARYFELHLLAVSGYELQVVACAACGADLPEAEAFFAAGAGGILCRGCRADTPGRLLSVRAQKVLRFARRVTVAEFAALRVPPETAAEVRGALAEALRAVVDVEPRSGTFFESVSRP